MVNLTLDTADRPKRNKLKEAISAIIGETPEDEGEELITEDSASAVGVVLAAIESELEMTAEAGVSAARDLSRLSELTSKLDAIGIGACARATTLALDALQTLRRSGDTDADRSAELVLRAYYIIRVASTQDLVLGLVRE
jgi:hypothetical protein